MAEAPLASITGRLSKLNPFPRSKRPDANDERGEQVTSESVGGGGHSARQTGVTEHELRVSHALRSYLVHHKILSKEDAGLDEPDKQTPAVKALLDKPHIHVPPELTNRSHPFPEYFISSSHNTYLIAHQLIGNSSASAYETALTAGSRCVEIDAWDNDEDKDEPKVTHGYTLVSNVRFRAVCETIRDVYDKEAATSHDEQGYRAAPILISLENHCNPHNQLRLVQIMKEVWGGRLLSKPITDYGHEEQEGGKHVRLDQLGSKIVVIVEHHIPNETDDSSEGDDDDIDDSTSISSSDEEEKEEARKEYKAKKKAVPTTIIIPELAELGVYAQSVKPSDNSWYESVLKNGPHHHLINVSEVALHSHLLVAKTKIAQHNAHHLMRVFPKGTRISSKNLNPVPFWGVGAQICALNWQTFGAGMQMNEALFSGTDGYVLKPAALRAGGNGKLTTGYFKKLRLHVAGASDVPVPVGVEADAIKPYVSCLLYHPDNLDVPPPKKKTTAYRQHRLGFIHRGDNPPPTDPVWDEVLEWEYEDNELVFLRMLVKSDDAFAANPVLAVQAIRVLYAVNEWRFVRMLDLKGRETRCNLLIKIEVVDV